MNRIDNSGKGIAGLGRNEDSMLAHVAPGEMVVPPVISPATQKIIQQEMMSAGLDPNEYTVGEGMSINPITGMAEFGFLKKLGKSLKKVVKKVAPIAAAVLPFVPGFQALAPGLQGFISGGLGKASGLSTKDALLGGLTVGMGAKFRNARQAAAAAAAPGGVIDAASKVDNRKFFGKGGKFRDFFVKGSDEKNFMDNVFGGFGGGGNQEVMYKDQFGNKISAADYAAMSDFDKPLYSQVRNPNILRQVLGSTPGQSGIGVIEDLIRGRESDFTKERGERGGLLGNMTGSSSGGGLNPAMLAMAALYGKAVKEDFKRKEGGLKDIRQSVRPDLMPQQTFQGFDLGVRKNVALGGLQELDMRNGGPSIGPGTGTSDDIPAMLSDGEFVMTSAANNGLGGFKITKTETGIELQPNGQPSRQKGAKNMDTLMKTFENFNKIGMA